MLVEAIGEHARALNARMEIEMKGMPYRVAIRYIDGYVECENHRTLKRADAVAWTAVARQGTVRFATVTDTRTNHQLRHYGDRK